MGGMYVALSSGGGSGAVIAGALSGVDLSSITTEFVAVIPLVLPIAITLIGIRKGISFLFGALRGA